MIGEAIDRLISVVSPLSAARRTQARHVYRQVSQRSYEAAKTNRLNSGWRTQNRTADAELSESADIIRARARALVRDNAYARGIVKTLVRNVVGCGIKPQAQVPGDEPLNTFLENAFAKWQKQADAAGRLTFYEMQALAYSEVLEAGEVLIRFVRSGNRRRFLPLALELVEADRFAVDQFARGFNPQTGNEVRRGVEVNADGEPVTYWLYSRPLNDLNSWRQEAKPYPASEFVHLFRQERAGQTRGVSVFAPVLSWVKNLSFYLENELQSSAIASCFTAAITTVAGSGDGGLLGGATEDTTDANGNSFELLEPGLVARLLPGEDVKVINPSRGHAESQAWIDLMIRSIAVGTGLSYERLSRDYSRTNYSSNRASDLEDRREFRPIQDWLASHLCEPVWVAFVTSLSLSQVEGAPTPGELLGNYDALTAAIHQPPGWEWVDPLKEMKAASEAVASYQSTLADELGKRGRDWKTVLTQRARELQFAQSLGLPANDTSVPVSMQEVASVSQE